MRLGPFDLDPCASWPRPWGCAVVNYTHSGLTDPWFGVVWLNPPFDRYKVGKWIAKLAEHGNGIALLHARTEAAWFLPVWMYAWRIMFLADRLYFHYPDGRRAEANSGAPACLVAFGDEARDRIGRSNLKGAIVDGWSPRSEQKESEASYGPDDQGSDNPGR
jgi:hypothetical protein